MEHKSLAGVWQAEWAAGHLCLVCRGGPGWSITRTGKCPWSAASVPSPPQRTLGAGPLQGTSGLVCPLAQATHQHSQCPCSPRQATVPSCTGSTQAMLKIRTFWKSRRQGLLPGPGGRPGASTQLRSVYSNTGRAGRAAHRPPPPRRGPGRQGTCSCCHDCVVNTL